MSSVEHWPDIAPEARWAAELMEELLATTTQTSEELLDRARELGEQAAATNVKAFARRPQARGAVRGDRGRSTRELLSVSAPLPPPGL